MDIDELLIPMHFIGVFCERGASTGTDRTVPSHNPAKKKDSVIYRAWQANVKVLLKFPLVIRCIEVTLTLHP